MKCRERMEAYLKENSVPFEVLEHSQAYTMQEVAAALHVPGGEVAKVVIVKAGDDLAMLVVPAPHRLDMAKVSGMLGAKKVKLAKEEDFSGLFPDCATGAMPPFGNLYNLPVYVDKSLAEQTSVIFRVGSHQQTMRVAYADFARLVQPKVADFTVHA